ncbi:amino acid adenylation domain-containing protein [Nonomuraea sp. NPDC050153]|uniref:amino acid adenylation domain-containing protein n=1 Tax=Nonomuraea sp. NPDC050153 TaxID=3364359 RepID=UPI0037BA1840
MNDLRGMLADLLDVPELGEHDNLIELGMDSITMMRLAGEWRRSGARIRFADLVGEPTLAAWRDLLAQRPAAPTPAFASADSRIDEAEPFPLALMQHAYWAGRQPGQRLGGVAAHFYNEFDGQGVDPARLERAVHALIERHGMLRVRILDDGTQRILDRSPWPGLTVHQGADLDELRRRLSHRAMDIGAGEVFDVQLSLLPDGGTRMHVNLDMVAADALSLRVLLSDLARLYHGAAPAPLTYSFPRYLAQRSAVRQEGDREHWQRRLPDLPGAPQLPASGHGEAATVVRRHRWVPPSAVRRLEQAARGHGLTTAMALAAVFAETLTAWSAEPRFLLNLPLFDREPLHPEVESLVGDFTSSVLLEWDGGSPGSFAERVRRLQERFHTDVAHSGYSGVEVLRDLSRLHGEQVLAPVVYTSALGLGELFAPEVTGSFGEPSWIISQGPQVWLDAQVTELNGGLLVNWDVREDAFTPGVPEAMFAAYGELIDRLLADGGTWSEPVPALLPEEQTQVRHQVNATSAPFVRRRLHDGFFARAAATPDAPALLWGRDGVMTYGELASRALQVAGHLEAQGAGDLVAISIPKGPAQVVAVLGVLASGAAYLPVGVDQPPARRRRILEAAGVRHVLDSVDVTAEPLAEPVAGAELAYVLYTSGSTGEPKGVEITHSAAMNTIDDLNDRFGIGPHDRALALSALEFDLSVYDLFGPLSAGGAVICASDSGRRDATAWAELLRTHRGTVLNCVPALLDMLLTVAEPSETLPLRLVLLGGDWVGLDLPGRLSAAAPGCRFVALGGTTETAIHSTVQEVDSVPEHWTSIPYGTPLRNVVCRVADGLGRDCPDWVAGELWIGGAGVARGYRGDPERTADRFVEFEGVRWYRTGDRARYWPDGTLEFLGRADHQVKLRGHRIELGEIEAALTAHPDVAQGVAVVTENHRLAAAVTGRPDVAGLRELLADRLPGPMLPDFIAVLPALPLTPNGKIDRATLRRTLAEHAIEAPRFTPPVGEIEERVAAAWAEILQVPEIGREHDFFALGGDSLLATRLISRLRADGLSGVSLSVLFANPALSDFAATLSVAQRRETKVMVADPANRHEPFPMTEVQRAYWLGRNEDFTLGGVGCHFYREYEVDDLDLARLETVVNKLVQRHEMLRAVFDEHGEQRILPEVPWFAVAEVAGLRETMSHTVFDPGKWPLFAIGVEREGDSGRTRLGIGVDNLVLDALSILTFYAELGELYDDPDAELPPVEASFRDYVLATDPPAEASVSHWRARLPALPPAPRLPLAKDPVEVTRPRFSRRAATIPDTVIERARNHGLTPSAVLLAAYAEVLGRWSAGPDVTLNLTLFDRGEAHPHIDRVLGDFTSLLLVPYEPEPGETWLDRVRRVQGRLWQAIDHRDVSTVWMLRELARISGDPSVTMPVVFTSALGIAAQGGGTLLGKQVYGVSQTPQVWLDYQVTEVDGGIQVSWDAVDELFPSGVLDAMFEAHLSLLEWLAGDWSRPVPDLLPSGQREVRVAVNATEGPVPGRMLHEEFFRRAGAEPDLVAVRSCEGGALTYGELAERARRLAAELQSRGAQPGEAVTVTLPKGPDQIVAVLGVLEAGCAYVPVGIDQPPARRERILRLAEARLRILPDLSIEVVDATPVATPGLAYVIFTSGSTGEPKGVEITHRSALNTVADLNERFAIGPGDRVLAVSALDFDLSVYDIFGPLSAGGSVVTITEDIRRDAHAWLELVEKHQVTIWNTVPALLDMLLTVGRPRSLRLALLSGDWVGLDLPGRLSAASPGCRFVALGGATEAAIWSNLIEVEEVDPAWRSIPYGRPLRNQRFRVVDDLGRDCPDWVTGELWIGGEGVARGYRSAPDLTAAQFVVAGGERWYRTGDLGRYWPDGTLEFLGRADQQVKIRGHRIELGEIEAALQDAPGVAQAVAAVSDGRLVAAVVPESIDLDAVRAHAATRLPEHMRPDLLAALPRLPLSANGKVDRAAVAKLSAPAVPVEPPRGELEEAVAAIWADLLDLDEVGRHQSFFALGGDSLRATRLIEALRGRLGVTITLRELFAAPTVASITRAAAEVEEGML